MSKLLTYVILICMHSAAFGQENFDLREPEYEPYIIELTPLSSENTGRYIAFEQEYKNGNTSYVIEEINRMVLSLDTVQIETKEKSQNENKTIRNTITSTRDFLSSLLEKLKQGNLIPSEKDHLHKFVFYYYLSAYNRQYWFTFPAITFQKDFSNTLYKECIGAYKTVFLNLSEPIFNDTSISFHQEYTNIGFFSARMLLKQLEASPKVLTNKDVSKFKGFLEDIISTKGGLIYRIIE